MRAKQVQSLAWVLIYSGLLGAVVGWFVQRSGAAWGHAVWVAGLLDAAAGVVLIWWRSRMKDEEKTR